MKFSNRESAESLSRQRGSIGRAASKYALAGAILLGAPLLDNVARAQEPEVHATTQAAQPVHSVSGERTSITDGSATRDVYLKAGDVNVPTLTIEGPARFTVRFYPAVRRDRFPEGTTEVSRPIEYSLGPAGGEQTPSTAPGTTRISGFTHREIDQTTLAIGTPIEITLSVPAGRHTFSVTAPNGFLELVRVEAPPAPVRPVQPVQPVAPVVRPEQPPVQPVRVRRPVFDFNGERLQLSRFGSMGNSGDAYLAGATGYVPVGDHLSILVNGRFSSYALTLQTSQATSGLRSYTGAIGAGGELRFGEHSVYALVFGGYRGISTSILSHLDGQTLNELSHGYELGGEGGYRYGRYFSLGVFGSNNPFNPLGVRLRGEIPWGWVDGYNPWAEVNMLWMHALVGADTPGTVGAVRLSDDELHFRGLVGVPLFRAGPFIPSVLAGGAMNASGSGMHAGSALLGGAIDLELLDRLSIQAAGLADMQFNPFEAAPLVLLRLNYSH
ncbi:MAG: hypothetical protein AB1529_02450 [Candidatus Micrarchaeota archaeon]